MFTKTAPQSNYAKRLLNWKQRPKVATESCSPKLLPKSWAAILPQNYSAKRLPKAAPHNCHTESRFPKLFVKLPPKAAPQSCCRKLLPKVAFSKLVSKAKLRFFKAAVQGCRAKLLLLPKAAHQNGSSQLLPKAVPQSTAAKRLPQGCFASNLFPKAAPQSYSPKQLRKQLRKVAAESCSPKVAF